MPSLLQSGALIELCTRLRSPRALGLASWYCGRLLSLMERSAERSALREGDDELRRTPVCAPVWAELLAARLR